MSGRRARQLAIGFFVLYTIFLTFPGIVPFNRIYPLVFGLPFAFFWIALWVALSGVVLLLLYRVEARTAREE